MVSPTSYGSSSKGKESLGQTPFFDKSGRELSYEKQNLKISISSLSG